MIRIIILIFANAILSSDIPNEKRKMEINDFYTSFDCVKHEDLRKYIKLLKNNYTGALDEKKADALKSRKETINNKKNSMVKFNSEIDERLKNFKIDLKYLEKIDSSYLDYLERYPEDRLTYFYIFLNQIYIEENNEDVNNYKPFQIYENKEDKEQIILNTRWVLYLEYSLIISNKISELEKNNYKQTNFCWFAKAFFKIIPSYKHLKIRNLPEGVEKSKNIQDYEYFEAYNFSLNRENFDSKIRYKLKTKKINDEVFFLDSHADLKKEMIDYFIVDLKEEDEAKDIDENKVEGMNEDGISDKNKENRNNLLNKCFQNFYRILAQSISDSREGKLLKQSQKDMLEKIYEKWIDQKEKWMKKIKTGLVMVGRRLGMTKEEVEVHWSNN